MNIIIQQYCNKEISKMESYVIINENGDYMDYDGSFGMRMIAISNATDWDYEEA
jgi:hypothetical protein